MLGDKYRWLKQSIEFVVKVRVLQAVTRYENEEAVESHHTYEAPHIVRVCQKVTASII